jgi:alkylation response protein AidB-like acyl-CoA dehydrogenase
MAWFTAANIGTAAYSFLTMANASLLLEHGTPEQVERFVGPMLEGRFFGTMTLSEPHAGSSLGDVLTRAVPADDGTYRVFGSKMWISGGDHEMGDNIVHLVLARLPDAPAGTRGISLFVVPKHLVADDGSIGERNDVALAGINHKLGSRGTVNTAPVFGGGAFTPGGAPGAVGYLVGEPHRGLSYMFHMMNAARLGVGMSATTTAYTAYLKALDYARSRPQGRRLGGADPGQPQVPIIEHADVRRMLLAQKAYVEGALALNLWCSRLLDVQASPRDDAEATEAGLLLDLLTPIAKSWPSQWGQESNSLAIQVLGGAGYTRDYDVEAHWRDQRLNPIHEGTHGIQALDLLGRKVLGGGGASLAALAGRIGRTVARAGDLGGEPAAHAEAPGWATRNARWPTPPSTWRRPATSWSRGCGSSSSSPSGTRRATSTTASGRPRATSSAGSCPRSGRCWTCSPRPTPPRWTCATPGSRCLRGPRSRGAAPASRRRRARPRPRGVRRAPPPARRRPPSSRSGRRGRCGAATTPGSPPTR